MSDQDGIKNWFWLIKNSIGVVLYGIITVVLYVIIADIHIQPPITLFTAVDYMIPFVSIFVIPYVFIFYYFVILTFGYFAYVNPQKFNKYFVAFLLIYAISFVTYIIFPVMMIRPTPAEMPTDYLSQIMIRYYEHDPPVNCFPSLHAANSTLAAYFLSREKPKYKWLFWGIAFTVILSTLFVRQHVIADELAGFLVAYYASWFADKKIHEEQITDKYKKIRIIFTLVFATFVYLFMISSYL